MLAGGGENGNNVLKELATNGRDEKQTKLQYLSETYRFKYNNLLRLIKNHFQEHLSAITTSDQEAYQGIYQ